MSNLLARLRKDYFAYHTLFYLSIISFLGELSYGIVNQSAMKPYLTRFGYDARAAGIVMSVFLVVEAALKSPMGSLGDRIGRRPLIVAGAMISGLTAIAMTFVHHLWGILALRVFDGIAAAAVWPTMMAAVSGSVPKEKRTMAMNAMTITYMLGIALCMLVGGYANDLARARHLLHVPEYASFYLVSGLFFITALVAFFLTPHRSREEMEHPHEESEKFKLSDLLVGVRALPDMVVLALLMGLTIGILIPIMKFFAQNDLGLSETEYGLIVLPIALGVALASLFAGRMGDRWGKARSVRLGIGIAMLGMWIVTISHAAWELIIASMLLGIGFVFAMPAWLAFVADISAPRLRGTVIGSIGAAQGIGAVSGSVLGGYLYARESQQFLGLHVNPHYAPFIISAVSLTLAFVLVLVFIRDGDCRRIGMPCVVTKPQP